MKKVNQNRKAFTLVELLIVIAIIGIMSSVVLVNLNKSKARKEVEGAAREIAAMIREIQNNALTGKMPSVEGEPKKPCWFSTRLSNEANDLKATTYSDIKDDIFGCTYDYEPLQVFKIFKNINYDDSYLLNYTCPDHIIRFVVPWGEIQMCGFGEMGIGPSSLNTDSGKIKLTSKKYSDIIYTICVYKTGRVTEIVGDVSC